MNISETIVTCCNGTGTKTFQMGCAECPAAKWNAFIGGGEMLFSDVQSTRTVCV